MPSDNPTVRRLVGSVAAAARWRRPELAELRRELAVARLAAKIENAMSSTDVTDREIVQLADVLCGAPATDEVIDR